MFNQSFMEKLNRMKLDIPRIRSMGGEGAHKSGRGGGAMEFSDYREYVPGDEFRHIDWKLFGRVEKLYIKEFARDEGLPVDVLLDSSASMSAGFGKWAGALKYAASLAYVGLRGGNPVQIHSLRDGTFVGGKRFTSFSQHTELFAYAKTLQALGGTNLNASLKLYSQNTWRKGLLVLISDFWEEGDAFQTLTMLKARGFAVAAIVLRSTEEENPAWFGFQEFVDSESGETMEMEFTPELRSAYEKNLREKDAQLSEAARKGGILFQRTVTDERLEDSIINFFKLPQLSAGF